MASSAAAAAAAGQQQTNSSSSYDPDNASLATTSAPLSKPNAATTTSSAVQHLAQRALDVTATSWSQWMTPRYALPNKAVASQVLMYRQLLHTACRPGLKLSRDYQGTPAQQAVLHMPWWEQGIEETRKMIISYDNLMSRLWYHGAIQPFQEVVVEAGSVVTDATAATTTTTAVIDPPSFTSGPPPIPHEFWVDRLGFQQPDPVTDFRSGGVLSLAMMVHMVESCPLVVRRFLKEDAPDRIVLPFAITCINVTDMLAKFLMLSKSVAQMDALLSQKPFWRMFDDPQSILSLQEISMTFLCDVVNELQQERIAAAVAAQQQQPPPPASNGSVRKLLWKSSSTAATTTTTTAEPQKTDDATNHQPTEEATKSQDLPDTKVTVFDFSLIMERTERRVRDDLLGAGPKTVSELCALAEKLQIKYRSQLERRIAPPPAPVNTASPFSLLKSSTAPATDELNAVAGGGAAAATDATTGDAANSAENKDASTWKAPLRVGGVAAGAIWSKVKSTTVAATVVAKMIVPTPSGSGSSGSNSNHTDTASPPDLLSGDAFDNTATGNSSAAPAATTTTDANASELHDWTDVASAADSVKHFSISDDEDDEML